MERRVFSIPIGVCLLLSDGQVRSGLVLAKIYRTGLQVLFTLVTEPWTRPWVQVQRGPVPV